MVSREERIDLINMPSPSLPIAKLGREQVNLLRQETVNQLAFVQSKYEEVVGRLQLQLDEIRKTFDADRGMLEAKLRAFDEELLQYNAFINILTENEQVK